MSPGLRDLYFMQSIYSGEEKLKKCSSPRSHRLRRRVFKTAQNDAHMATTIVEHMTNNAVKTVAYIGFSDAYGEGWWNEFAKLAEVRKIPLVGNERFNRTDTTGTGQILKILAAKPDAVVIGGAGMPAALPQKSLKEKGYKGTNYQTHGVVNNDFRRICGKDCEGTVLPTGPVLVAAQLPADNPVKKSASDYVSKYEAAYSSGSATPSATMPGMPNSVPHCAMRWKRPGTSPPRMACST